MSKVPGDYIDAYDDGYKHGRDDRSNEMAIRITEMFADGKITKDVCDDVIKQISDSNDNYINQVYDMGFNRGCKVGLESFLSLLTKIDNCEFAMFTLCLIKEKVDEAYESLVMKK